MAIKTLCWPISEPISGESFRGTLQPYRGIHCWHLRYAKHASKGVASVGHVPGE